ncbi:MAG: hypothetical protein PHD85_01305 [Bacilli bacterium]|nr:hypothetical protein [Bacilli bacterium]
MKKYLMFLAILLIAFISVGCRDPKDSLYKDGKIFECESYYKTTGTTRFDILEMSTDTLGNPNSGFKYYRLVFFADRTFAFVSFLYSSNKEEVKYGTWSQKDEIFEEIRIDENGQAVKDIDGKVIYDKVTKSVITLTYYNIYEANGYIFPYEKYVVSFDQLTLTRNQPHYIDYDHQAIVEQVWKRIDIKDTK